METYGIGSHAYLARAKARFNEGTHEALFYAALELRCYVEARQDTYLDTQKQYVSSVPPSWKIGHQWKALEKVMEGPRIQYLAFSNDAGFALDAFYVPVSASLKNGAERLSELIHAQHKSYPVDHEWWTKTRDEIRRVYRHAWTCERGNMLCPALIAGGKMIGSFTTAIQPDSENLESIRSTMVKNALMSVKVDYLTHAPQTWVPDL